MRILVVEDDRLLGDGLATGLKTLGHGVDWVRDGEAALAALETESFAAVVLDHDERTAVVRCAARRPLGAGVDARAWRCHAGACADGA